MNYFSFILTLDLILICQEIEIWSEWSESNCSLLQTNQTNLNGINLDIFFKKLKNTFIKEHRL